MSLKSSDKKGGGTYIPVEPGNYPARIVRIVDLGLQPQVFKGEAKKPAYMLSITYELTTEFMKDENGNDMEDKPRWISESFNIFSLDSDRAKSTIRYNALDPLHVYKGDWSKLLGVPCLVTIVSYKKGDGTEGTKVGHVAGPMKGFVTPELVNEAAFFDLDEPNMELFEEFPDWMKEKIKSNLEYAGSVLNSRIENKEEIEDDVEEDDIPF